MTKIRGVTGGGIDGNKVTQTRAPKVEPKPYAMSIGAVSRLGGMVGEGTPHKALYNHQGYTTPIGTTPAECKPGGGRMVLPAGTQAKHGPDRPMGKGRSLFK